MTPIEVWDVKEESWMGPQRPARAAWLRKHGVPVDITYRTEFYLLDAPFVRLYTYHLDGEGRKHLTANHVPCREHDHSQCKPAVNAPYDMPLSELPPPHLRQHDRPD